MLGIPEVDWRVSCRVGVLPAGAPDSGHKMTNSKLVVTRRYDVQLHGMGFHVIMPYFAGFLMRCKNMGVPVVLLPRLFVHLLWLMQVICHGSVPHRVSQSVAQ